MGKKTRQLRKGGRKSQKIKGGWSFLNMGKPKTGRVDPTKLIKPMEQFNSKFELPEDERKKLEYLVVCDTLQKDDEELCKDMVKKGLPISDSNHFYYSKYVEMGDWLKENKHLKTRLGDTDVHTKEQDEYKRKEEEYDAFCANNPDYCSEGGKRRKKTTKRYKK